MWTRALEWYIPCRRLPGALASRCSPSFQLLSARRHNHGQKMTPAGVTLLEKQSRRFTDKGSCMFCTKRCQTEFQLMEHISKCHLKQFSRYLCENPVKIYSRIFGEEHTRIGTDRVSFSNGVEVFVTGDKQGQWYDPALQVGGEPVRAIMQYMGGSFIEAMKVALTMTDFNDTSDAAKTKVIQTAESMWNASESIVGTLAEKYLVQHRKIPRETIPHLAFRFAPRGMEYDDTCQEKNRLITIPSLLVRVENARGHLTALQRIYLDDVTAMKAAIFTLDKKTIGFCKYSAGIVQRGEKGGVLCVVEGPETGATLAAALGHNCTVLASLSLSLLSNLTDVILSYSPEKVILAADVDVNETSHNLAASAYFRLKRLCRQKNMDFRLALPRNTWVSDPDLKDSEEKEIKAFDWNDVLKNKGFDEVKTQLGVT